MIKRALGLITLATVGCSYDWSIKQRLDGGDADGSTLLSDGESIRDGAIIGDGEVAPEDGDGLGDGEAVADADVTIDPVLTGDSAVTEAGGAIDTGGPDSAFVDAAVTSVDAGVCEQNACEDSAVPAGDPAADTQILALHPFSWIAADYFSTDSASGKVSAYLEKVAAGTGVRRVDDGHAFEQSAAARQTDPPSGESRLNGVGSSSFSSHYYDSSAPPVAWTFLHNGSGSEVFSVFVPTDLPAFSVLFSTTPRNTNAGDLIFLEAQAGYQDQVLAGSSLLSPDAGGAGFLRAGLPSYFDSSYQEGASPEMTRRIRATVVASGNSLRAPSSAAPGYTARLGASPSNGDAFVGRWAMQLIFDRVLTEPERTVVQNYISAKFGLTP